MFFARFLTTHRACVPALVPVLIAAGCNYDITASLPSPSLTIDVSVATTQMEVGQEATATARGRDQYGVPVDIGPITWTSRHPEVVLINPNTGAMLAIAPGTTEITATVDGKSPADHHGRHGASRSRQRGSAEGCVEHRMGRAREHDVLSRRPRSVGTHRCQLGQRMSVMGRRA